MSIAKQRVIQCYPSPRYEGLLKAFAIANGISKSQAAEQSIRCMIDNLPIEEQLQLQKIAKGIKGSKNNY